MVVLPGVLGCRPLRRTVQVRLGTNTLRLPGGTAIFVVSRQQFIKHPGQFKSGDSPPPLLLYKRCSFTLSRLNGYCLSLIYEASQALTPRTVPQLANSLFLNLSYAFFGDTETFTYGLQGLGGPAINAKSGLEDSFFSA